jgi:hypothetical protein
MTVTTHEVKQLKLAPGDILVVKTSEAAERLKKAGKILNMTFSVPIIIAPDGIELVDKDHLSKLIGYRQLTMTELKESMPNLSTMHDAPSYMLTFLGNLNKILSKPKEEYMAPKKLTIIEAYKRLDKILADFRNNDVTSEPTAELIYALNRDALAAGLPFNINIDEEDLKESEIGTATEYSYNSSYKPSY